MSLFAEGLLMILSFLFSKRETVLGCTFSCYAALIQLIRSILLVYGCWFLYVITAALCSSFNLVFALLEAEDMVS